MDSIENAATSNNDEAFSIRDYVLEARKKDIHNNWPFHEKYLELCVKHGVDKLLPPFESLDSVRYSLCRRVQSQYTEEPGTIDSKDNCCLRINEGKEFIKVESTLCIDEAVSDITRQMSPLSLSANKYEHDDGGSALPSTKCPNKKRKKRKGKHKMRSLAEIYAVASPCTLEDSTKINGSTSADVATVMPNDCNQGALESERCVCDTSGSMTTSDHDYRHNPEGLQITDSIGGIKENGNFVSEDKHLIKFKFSGCKSKTHNKKAIS